MPDPITDKDELLPPLSFRRGLVFGTGFSLLLISIITVKNMWVYFDNNTTSINEFLLLIFSSWGISYVIFLWLSFFVIVIKKLPGCAWTGIKKGLLKSGDVHICVDSVLNARQDMEQKKSGISIELLKTDGSRLWIIGLIALLIFAYTLTLDIIPIYLRLLMLGVISSLYYLYDITVHEFSKNRRTLDGVGDYGDLLRMYLRWSPKDS
ncbi:MAG TPA: hypothetical protein VD710_07290 [Nitrososphaeraceae archaeon]|nr:hypothetical protein [Nitrososphaeraceae archaeon]